jgi:hypothetical protein
MDLDDYRIKEFIAATEDTATHHSGQTDTMRAWLVGYSAGVKKMLMFLEKLQDQKE